MPWIKPERRKALAKGSPVESAGEATYLYYKTILDYWNQSEKRYSVLNYIHAAVLDAADFCLNMEPRFYSILSRDLDQAAKGFFDSPYTRRACLFDAYSEFHRLYHVPYEEEMRQKNGDIR
jgi:hypothetical protein